MNTKIAFFDIDGTLVNVPNGMLHPTDETIRVLNEFKNQGNKIVIATARGEDLKVWQTLNLMGIFVMMDIIFVLIMRF